MALVREALHEHQVDCSIVVMSDGEKAIHFIDSIDASHDIPCPDIILLDLNLPRRSGREVLTRLRASSRCAHARIVVLSSSDAPKDKQESLRLGADGYIRKPTALEDYMRIGQLLKDMLREI